MSDGAASTPPAAPAQGELVLGGGAPPAASANGASGTQTPAPATTVSATPATAPAAEAKPADAKVDAPKPTEAEAKVAAEKAAVEAKAVLEKAWAEFKPAVPEGYTLDAEGFKEFSSVAKELGLEPAKAQKLVEFQAKRDIAGAKANAAKMQAESDKFFADQRKEFITRSTGDKEYGGNNDAALRTVNKAFEKYVGQDGLKELLARHPNIDADPVLFKAFYRMGLALKDDSISGAAPGAAAGQKTQDQILREMYPNSPTLFSQS